VQIGEFNMNWGDESQNNTPTQTVWVANALGSILAHGGVAFQYGDKNNAMGLTSDGGKPKASYWGLGMFTGASKFRHFGTNMVASTSGDEAVKVYASNNAKNIVVVNSGAATQANLKLTGYAGGTAHVWQSTNIDLVDKGVLTVANGAFSANVPAKSVTTYVLDGGAATPVTDAPVTPTTATPVVTTAKPATTTTTAGVPVTATPTTAPTTTSKPATTVNTATPITGTVGTNAPLTTHGLKAQYFNNVNLSGDPVLTRTDATVNFNWSTGSPGNGVNADNFSVRWTGKIQAPKSETYTFRTSSDDGVRLWINGTLVIDNWTDHTWTDNTAKIAMVAGHSYDIRMEYYERAVTAVAILRWSSPSTPLAVVPKSALLR
jgi:hypothetical protein